LGAFLLSEKKNIVFLTVPLLFYWHCLNIWKKKRSYLLFGSSAGQYAPGFGIGALEELGVEDEDIYASGFAYEQMEVDIEPSKTASDSNYKLEDRKRGVFLAFKIASSSEYKLER
jgi:hypothetical protein